MKTTSAERIIRLASLTVLSCLAAMALLVLAQRAAWMYPLENFEGAAVHTARAWQEGGPLYADVARGELPVYNYPPLYIALLRLWPNIAKPFLPGRLISLGSLLLAASLAGLFARRLTAMPDLAVFTLCFFLILPENLFLGALVRADALAAVCSLAALFVGYRGVHDKKWLAVAAVLGSCAWFAKQTALAGPAALFLWLLVTDRRAAGWFGAWYGGLLTAAIGAAEWATGGLFLKNVLSYSVTEYAPGRLWFFVKNYFLLDQPQHGLVIAGIALGLVTAGRRGWRASPLFLYLALTLLSLVALGKDGASRLYYFEFHLAAAITAGAGLYAVGKSRRQLTTTLLALFAAVAVLGLPTQFQIAVGLKGAAAGNRQLVDLLRQAEGAVLLEDAGYAVLAGHHDLDMVNPFLARRLFERGLADPAPYLAKVHAGAYPLIVLDSPAHQPDRITQERYPVSLLIEIATHYRQAAVIGGHVLYAPRTKD